MMSTESIPDVIDLFWQNSEILRAVESDEVVDVLIYLYCRDDGKPPIPRREDVPGDRVTSRRTSEPSGISGLKLAAHSARTSRED